jgi:hypothetical protein
LALELVKLVLGGEQEAVVQTVRQQEKENGLAEVQKVRQQEKGNEAAAEQVIEQLEERGNDLAAEGEIWQEGRVTQHHCLSNNRTISH